MGWRHNRYIERPAARNRAARVAWDSLTQDALAMNPPRRLVRMWYADEMDDGVWNARLDGEEDDYIEMDGLCVRDMVNNPHKYENIDKDTPK